MYLKTREEIFDLLQQAVEALVPMRDFEARLAYLFVDREGWPILDHGDKAFFGIVLERAGWTAVDPSEEEKSMGWMSFDEFRTWLGEALERHLKGEDCRDQWEARMDEVE